MHRPARALVLALCSLLTLQAWCYDTDFYTPPSWACSPGRPRNPLCPAPADGDSRCTFISCMQGAGCATTDCNAVQGSVHSDYSIVLDAWLQRGTTCVKTAWTLSECCRLCQQTPQCNAWSYCNNPAGCGLGCDPTQHNFQFAAGIDLWRLDPLEHPSRLNPEHKCLPEGQWPYQTCSLKFVSGVLNVAAPPLASGSDTLDGWVSGIVPKPGQLLSTDVAAAQAAVLAAAAAAAAAARDAAAEASSAPASLTADAAASSAAEPSGVQQLQQQQAAQPAAALSQAAAAVPAAAAAAAPVTAAAPAQIPEVDPQFEDQGTLRDGKDIYQEIMQPFPYSANGQPGSNQLLQSGQQPASDLPQHPGLWQQQQSAEHVQQQQLGHAAAAAVAASGMAAAWHAQAGSASDLPSMDAAATPLGSLGLGGAAGGIQPLSVQVIEDGQVGLLAETEPGMAAADRAPQASKASKASPRSSSPKPGLHPNNTVVACVFLSSLIIFSLMAVTCVIVLVPTSTFTWLMHKVDFGYERL